MEWRRPFPYFSDPQRSELFLSSLSASALGLIHVLDEWMKRGEHHEKLYPCWWSVVYVVADSLGGSNTAAARTIAMKWEGMHDKKTHTPLSKG